MESTNNFVLIPEKDIDSPSPKKTEIKEDVPFLFEIDPYAPYAVRDPEMASRFPPIIPSDIPSLMPKDRINNEIGQYYKPGRVKTQDTIILPNTTETGPVTHDSTDQAPKSLPSVVANVNEHVDDDILSIYPRLNSCFSSDFYESVFSSDLDGLKTIFMDVQDQIGKSKMTLAVFIYRLHLEWERNSYEYKMRYGVDSLMEVIDSLPIEYLMTRQTYNNYKMAGEIFVKYALDSYEGVNNGGCLRREVIANLFLKNYSKLPYIYYWMHANKRRPITLKVLLRHVENDNVREFKIYIRSKIIQSKQDKPKNNKALNEMQDDNVPAMPELTEEQRFIIQEMAKGRYIHLYSVAASSDTNNFQAVKTAIDAHYSRKNKQYRTTKEGILNYLESLGYFPYNLVSLIKTVYLTDIEGQLKEIQPILVRECRIPTQLRLAQALILVRFDNDKKLNEDIYLQEEKHLSSIEIAKKYLGIDNESLYKYLRRISIGLYWLPTLMERGIDPLAPGTLDKIGYFGKAVATATRQECSFNQDIAITECVEAFLSCSVKEFRQFAKNGELPDIFTDKKRFWKFYYRAKKVFDEIGQKRNKGYNVYPLSLNSKADVKLVKECNEDYKDGLLQSKGIGLVFNPFDRHRGGVLNPRHE